VSDRKNRYLAVRSFYEYHRVPLPKPSRTESARCFRPSELDKLRAIDIKPLEVGEVRKVILNATQPYKAALMVVFQSGMSLNEFNQFNTIGWERAVGRLDEEGPIRIDLVREKTSRFNVRKYYTFIGEDSKMLIKDWIKMKPAESNTLFIVFNKNKRDWVPLTGRNLGNYLTKIAKKIGLIKPNGMNRYHIHLHEFRDLFKSLCTLHGVNPVASEFFLGHTIDKLGYDKSPEYNEDWFRSEYMKVEPALNILSNPEGKSVDKIEMIKTFARSIGADITDLKIARMREEYPDASEEELIGKIIRAELQAMKNSKEYKAIDEEELVNFLREGWEIVQPLNGGKIVISRVKNE